MKAVTWQGVRDVQVLEVPDPALQQPDDIIIEVTSTGLCGSDLHLYETLGPFMTPGDIVGHEPMGVVVEKGAEVKNLDVGDRVVIPFQIACGHCFMCDRGLQTQCETTQVRSQGTGAALFGFSSLYGSVPGGQAQYLRVPHGDYGPIRVGSDLPDDRYVFLSDVIADMTDGRGADAVIDAVGMEAHGGHGASALQKIVGALPDKIARSAMTTASVDRMAALDLAFASVRRGGTVSVSGVYAGTVDPFSMQELFDKQVTIRMGQANVKRWIDDLLPLVEASDDPLGVEDFATHRLPLSDAAHAYDIFQKKQDGAIKIVFDPRAA